MKRLAVCLFALAGLSSGCTIRAAATTPTLNVLVNETNPGTVVVDTSEVPNTAVCSKQAGLKDFCVTEFQSAMQSGLETLMSQYVDGSDTPQYTAVFRLIEFSHATDSGSMEMPVVQVSLRWQFELRDGDRAVVQLAETTVGQEKLQNVGSADKAIKVLLGQVTEKIGAALSDAQWQPAVAEEPAADELPTVDPADAQN